MNQMPLNEMGKGKSSARFELKTSPEVLQTIFESISDGFFILDPDWRYRYLNEKAADLARQPAAELLGKNIWREFPEVCGTQF